MSGRRTFHESDTHFGLAPASLGPDPAAYDRIFYKDSVVGGWVRPQASGSEPKMSVRLVESSSTGHFEAVYLLPDSAQFGRRMFLDADTRLTVEDGFEVTKTLYFYSERKKVFEHLPNTKQGYGQVIQAGWRTLYPDSPTNPPRSLT